MKDEHPVDCIDGVTPVETYGYEAEFNSALTQQIAVLEQEIKEVEKMI